MAQYVFLQEQTYEYLRQLIFDEHLEYDTIYSEAQIARQMNCSRTPVREAIVRLQHDRYVDIIPSKGFMLHRITMDDISSTYQVRTALESYCSLSVQKALQDKSGIATLARLKAIHEELRTHLEARDIEKFVMVDYAFHYEIIEFSKCQELVDIYKEHTYRITKLSSLSLRAPGRLEESFQEHQRILDAITSGSVADMYDAVLHHSKQTFECNKTILLENLGKVGQPQS